MDEFRNAPQVVFAQVAKLAARSDDEADLFADSLFARCWPGGCEDRFDPVAVGWLRGVRMDAVEQARIEPTGEDPRGLAS